ncbi:DNA glycosylase/AP lyase ROS1-like [Rutidosis leptorrhynchoides]|uniref:DNA glycosylase/AP lyase ROS1-like n=1 Tax=Rutidosis leptorrhynchoides TaxID=125765 RepID=UPI003A99D5BB
MDEGGEGSSSHHITPNKDIYDDPVTPANPTRFDPNTTHRNWLETPFDKPNFEETSVKKGFNSWESNKFCLDDAYSWNTISCSHLLALADANNITKQYCISDLNLPPQTITDTDVNTGLSLQFTPLTPDKGGSTDRIDADESSNLNVVASNKDKSSLDGSTLVEANQDLGKRLTEQTNVNETPQPKEKRRRKHRPKVVKEGQPKQVRKRATPKPETPNPDGSSTVRKKYVRKKAVEKSPLVEGESGPVDPSAEQQIKKTCKRKIDFDGPEKQTEVTVEESQVDQAVGKGCATSEVENGQPGLERGSLNPITPIKTDLKQGRSKTSVKVKRPINFIQEKGDNYREKEPSSAPSPNESNCSTSTCCNKGAETQGSKAEFSSNVSGMKHLEKNARENSRESLEEFLSPYTDYNSNLQLPAVKPKKRIRKNQSVTTAATSASNAASYIYKWNFNRNVEAFTMVHTQNHTYTEPYTADFQVCKTTKKKTKKPTMLPRYNNNHIGWCPYPYLGCISIQDVDDMINRFEQLYIDKRRVRKSRNALVPYVSGYHEKNALVVYQQNGSLVPYEGAFNPVRRRKPRAKVDLDDETNRVWMLLLENINSEGIDGTDETKAKWWEEERRVFRGRADSFIARMHLVQGDRRFSKWKGSVLDSVVGVFLTQNVSDHLSSSAFMSLAARFPLGSNNNNEAKEACQEDEDRGSVNLQDAYLCEDKEIANEVTKISNSNINLNDNSECEVLELSEKGSPVDDILFSSHNSANTSPSSVQSSVVHIERLASSSKITVRDELPNTCSLRALEVESVEFREETNIIGSKIEKPPSVEREVSSESAIQTTVHMVNTISSQESVKSCSTCNNCEMQEVVHLTHASSETSKSTKIDKIVEFNLNVNGGNQIVDGMGDSSSKIKNLKNGKEESKVEWDNLRLEAEIKQKRERTRDTMDSLDYEAVRAAHVDDVADSIKERGMNNRLAARIKDMLDRLVKDHGSLDLEWLRDVPPDKAKEYLLSFKGLGLKSVECIRLLTLHHLAFPVDVNVGRIAVRLGWVPLQPLPESLQLHLLELYPVQETIQKYLWPRLCKLDQRTLYELHYQMITFGKVFCTKTKPNCNACPLRGECRHFASAFASARLSLPAPEDNSASLSRNRTDQKMIDLPQTSSEFQTCNPVIVEPATSGSIVEVPATPGPVVEVPVTPASASASAEPIIEVPASPEPEQIQQISDIEDFGEDPDEIPMIKLNIEQFTQNLQTYMERHMELGEGDMSKALVAITSEAASIPTPKLKNVSQLRTEHQVYELPDSHPLLAGVDTREPDDPSPYLLAIWTPGETADSFQPPEGQCNSQESGILCNEETCFFCNSTREANFQTVRGTLLIPCRTATRGSFPLNGTYFQVNEVFADHASSLNPIDVPRSWLWNLPRRTVYFGTSIPTIFKGMTTEAIQYCFWRGFVCVRGFDQETRVPRPLMARLHLAASKRSTKAKTDEKRG